MKNFAGLIFSLLLSPATQATMVEDNDHEVVNTCLSSIYRSAHGQTPSRELEVIYASPQKRNDKTYPSKEWFINEIPDIYANSIASAYDNLQRRTNEPWHFPESLILANIPVISGNPPRAKRWYETKFFISFWPPGYSESKDYSIVAAEFGPSDHGSIAFCLLRKDQESWATASYKVYSYL